MMGSAVDWIHNGTSSSSSGCESGWTLYLEEVLEQQQQQSLHNSQSQIQKRRTVDDDYIYEEEDDDSSMVSDASSGPPHFAYIDNRYNCDSFINYNSNPAYGGCYARKSDGLKSGEEVPRRRNYMNKTSSSSAMSSSRTEERDDHHLLVSNHHHQQQQQEQPVCDVQQQQQLDDTASSPFFNTCYYKNNGVVHPATVSSAGSIGFDFVNNYSQQQSFSATHFQVVMNNAGQEQLSWM